MPLAALPMYDLPELRAATDALWTAIAARLRDSGVAAPDALTRDVPLENVWTDPDLLLAQTCGYPLATSLKDRVTLVATPRYLAPGCVGACYSSALLVRADDPAVRLADLRGRRCAINTADSNSGMNLLRHAVRPLTADSATFFGACVLTGAHAESIRAVARGDADLAAIDCVTWAHLQHLRPAETRCLRVLGWSASSPGLPLITSLKTDDAMLRALRVALGNVERDLALTHVRQALRLDGFSVLGVGDYAALIEDDTREKEGLLF